jgi:DNA-binding response OmpR family regulator
LEKLAGTGGRAASPRVRPRSVAGVSRILLVEDDAGIAGPLVDVLQRQGYQVRAVTSGRVAIEAAHSERFDLVLLDLGLPDLDGVEVCRRLKAQDPQASVMMLTARTEEVDAVVGLDAGADDYVPKPFRLAELLARVRARLRARAEATVVAGDAAVADVNGIRVDRDARRAWVDDRELTLSPKEFDLLALLVREAGRVVPRTRIMSEVWDEHWFGSTKTLDTHVAWLRRKLGDDPDHPRWISTVRGVGLRFETGVDAE